jgi:high affinity sulfate transporter 1
LKLFDGVRPITRQGAIRDALAGVTLAAMNIPEVLGYARIAGMPLATGLYTAILAPFAFALLGSSRHLVVAADSATAAILSGSVSTMAAPGSAAYVSLVVTVALLTAGMLLAARVFKLGFLADFLSRTVLVGFLTGVGVQVGAAMLGDMLGLAVTSRNTLARLWQVAIGAPHLSAPTLALSALVVAVILIGRRFLPRAPTPLVLVAATILASHVFDFAGRGVAVLGPLAAGLPTLHWPAVTWTQALALTPVAASCFVVIIAQSAATARVFAGRYREQLDENADILGLAAANAASALGGAFVVNGSPTQTAMAERAGGRSQFAQLMLALSVLVALLTLIGQLQDLPRCVLSGIIFTIAIDLVDLATLRAMRRESPGEFQLALVTAVAVALVGVEEGVLLAVALSLFRHVRHSYQPHTAVLKHRLGEGWWEEPATPGMQTEPGLIIYRFNADLFYANAAHFADEVRSLVDAAPSPVKWVVIEADAITNLDYSAARVLVELLADFAKRKVKVAFARVGPLLRADMDRHGVTPLVGAHRLLPTRHGALALVRGEAAT